VQCKVCRSNVEEGQSVCPYCGSALAPQLEVPTPINIAGSTAKTPRVEKKRKKKTNTSIVLIVIIVLVGILAAVFLVQTIRKNAESVPQTEEPMPVVRAVRQSDILRVQASSCLTDPEIGTVHSADRVIDGQTDTAWAEGVDGYGAGEEMTLVLKDSYKISGFRIAAGYHKNEKLYYENARPKTVTVTLSDGSQVFCSELEDVYAEQTVWFDREVVTDAVTIRVDSVYIGSKYEDTVISEIVLF